MNFFSKAQQQYEQLWKYIIRPTRTTYPQKSLGPQTFQLQGKTVKRRDFQVVNPRGFVIFASHFIPLNEQSYPCVIYMHGNSSNRTQGMEYLGNLIRHNISLCTFDFSGCGNAEGQYVSLGLHEQDDLNEVIEHIRRQREVTQISIWGRSMGAVTGLLYIRKSQYITSAVFDSPFKSLKSLIEDICKKNTPNMPNLLIAGALKIISKTIQEKAQFSIYNLNPLKYEVPFLNYPAFFIVASEDDIIPPDHGKTLYEYYKGQDKTLEVVKGPDECVENVIKFLLKKFKNSKINLQKSEQNATFLHSKVKQKQGQYDFFNDEDEENVENSSAFPTAQEKAEIVDFFAKEQSHQNQVSSDFLQNSSNQYQHPSASAFSLTSMLSNVFGASQKKIERGNDGYQKTMEKITQQLKPEQNSQRYQNSKSEYENFFLRQKAELKKLDNNHSSDFEKQILANLETWAF